MDPAAFYQRWAAHLDWWSRETFLFELAALLAAEQARERRRITTDRTLYIDACRETADEIRRAAEIG